ncbi:hypothetical protein CLOSPO_03757 [Clostridium sporogenes ATCC 15579]|nr:hypothetical protein CLOSPO_03757 [Clostridium sporogenes ATCC 15579]
MYSSISKNKIIILFLFKEVFLMKSDEKSRKINNKTNNDRMYEKKPDWDLDKDYEKRQQMILDSVRGVK